VGERMKMSDFWVIYTIKKTGTDEVRYIVANAPNGWVGTTDKKIEKKLKDGEYIDLSQMFDRYKGRPVEVVK
jgi:hypothetical protein